MCVYLFLQQLHIVAWKNLVLLVLLLLTFCCHWPFKLESNCDIHIIERTD